MKQQERGLHVLHAGCLGYLAAWDLQRRLAQDRQNDVIPDTLILVEHPPTYTIGRSGGHDHLLVDRGFLAAQGADVVEVDRGGDITYHGPGQLVGYPILQIKDHGRDLHRYLRMLEQVVIDVLADYDVKARRFEGYTGVWVGDEKIAAIGIRVNARGVTSHGFALNITTDLHAFQHIIPCGIREYGVTSLERLLGLSFAFEDVAQLAAFHLARVFDLTITKEMVLDANTAVSLGASR